MRDYSEGTIMENKHAYMIMAHTDFPILVELVKALDDKRNDIFVHVDTKSRCFPKEDIEQAVKKARLFIIERMNVNWGGPSQIVCELHLMESAAKQEHYAYYHLMTGQTYPIKSQNYIHRFFEEHNGYEFIGFDNTKDYSERVRYVHLYPEIGKGDILFKKLLYKIRNKFIQLQKFIKYERKETRGKFFKKGFVYWSLTDEAIRYIVEQKQEILSVFKCSSCADELFTQTILYNSPFKEKIFSLTDQYGSCLRIVKPVRSWQDHRNIIKTEYSYTVDDFEELIKTNRIFALKFRGESGLKLIKRINETILSEDK
jgi:hypothetical protein